MHRISRQWCFVASTLMALILAVPLAAPGQDRARSRDAQSQSVGDDSAQRPAAPHAGQPPRGGAPSRPPSTRGGQLRQPGPRAGQPRPPAPHGGQRPPAPRAGQPRPPAPRGGQPHAEPRYPGPRYPGPRYPNVRPAPGYHPPLARPPLRAYPEQRYYGYARPRVHIPVFPYSRPYYDFHPRYWLGFGLYLGYPVPYPLMYGYPSYVYSNGVIIASPTEASMYGGISLTISPDDASVIVDGVYVGIARDFSTTYQPLTLTPGRHHIELQAHDRVPLAFDVDIVAGEVLPFHGTLQPD